MRWLFYLLLPVFLFSTNIHLAASSPTLYNYGFKSFNVPQRLNLSPQEVVEIGEKLRHFFYSPQSNVEEVAPTFFNQKEKIHLQDIKNLIRLNYNVWRITGIALLILGLTLLIFQSVSFPQTLIRGGLVTLGIFLVLLLLLFFAFDRLFLTFHLISFPNEYWRLDPAKDKLIILFPPQFFYRATIFIVLGVIVQALFISGLGFITCRWAGSWGGSRRSK